MVCTSYESPDDAAEDDQHDFSMVTDKLACRLFLSGNQPNNRSVIAWPWLSHSHSVQERPWLLFPRFPPPDPPFPHPSPPPPCSPFPCFTGFRHRQAWGDISSYGMASSTTVASFTFPSIPLLFLAGCICLLAFRMPAVFSSACCAADAAHSTPNPVEQPSNNTLN